QPATEPLTGHTGAVYAVCPVTLPDGCTVLASSGRDRTVLVWTFPGPTRRLSSSAAGDAVGVRSERSVGFGEIA
ncbi:WD40 repeat domain-containing protein, partial [Pseudonocardia eucalypti]|uniref:WD40 repeat domain-containing protein n=1 Tax=Pseudonocardia eucalypti TaxID=648755 RepID=UPI003CD0B7C2